MRIEEMVDISQHTTFGVGGFVRWFVEVKSAEDLSGAVGWAKKRGIRYAILAGGSNVVFANTLDDLFVIKISGGRINWGVLGTGFGDARSLAAGPDLEARLPNAISRIVAVDAGAGLGELVDFTITNGLQGLEAMIGIPGTVGGAIVGNAAAYGQAISDHLVRLEVLDSRTEKTRRMSREECRFSYRNSLFNRLAEDTPATDPPETGPGSTRSLASNSGLEARLLKCQFPDGLPKDPGEIILRAEFAFPQGNAGELKKKSQEILAIRTKKYPPGLKCPGSFFKNVLVEHVPGTVLAEIPNLKDFYGKVPAWYFLNAVGARGLRQGGVYISDYHGNLLINDGTATYADVRCLAETLKQRVTERFSVELEEEVRYIA